jgi:hypothetical protein
MNDISSRLLEETPEVIASRLMQKASHQDGLPEIAVGLMLLTFAALYGLQVVFPPGSTINKDASSAVLVLMMLMIIPFYGLQWATKKIRARFLMGRVGYVKLKPLNRRQFGRIVTACLVAMGVAAVLAAIVSYFVFSRHPLVPFRMLLAVNGIGFASLAAIGGRRIRYYVLGGLEAAIGIVLAFSGVSMNAGMTILYALPGLFCLVSGCIALTALLRTPVEAGE